MAAVELPTFASIALIADYFFPGVDGAKKSRILGGLGYVFPTLTGYKVKSKSFSSH